MAKSPELWLKKVEEVSDKGDILCSLNKNTVLTHSSKDDRHFYSRLNVAKGTDTDIAGFSGDTVIDNCTRFGPDRVINVESGNRLIMYNVNGHFVSNFTINKNGKPANVDQITAVAVADDVVFVAEFKRYNGNILVVKYATGEAAMSLPVDEKVKAIIPVSTGLILVRFKERIVAMDFYNYPRVDTTPVMTVGRTLVNTCVKGPHDEVYVLFVKGITPKVLEVVVLDDSYEEIRRTKITHTMSILSLRALFTSSAGYLIIQMGNIIHIYKSMMEGLNEKKTPIESKEDKDPPAETLTAQNIGPVLVETNHEAKEPDRTQTSSDINGKEQEKRENEGEKQKKDSSNRSASKHFGPGPGPSTGTSSDTGPVLLETKEKPEKRRPQGTPGREKEDTLSQEMGEKLTIATKQTIPPLELDRNEAGRASPVFVSKYIGTEGGEISSKTYGFSLKVPPGAIPRGQRKKIGVELSRESGGSAAAGSGFCISPDVHFTPAGMMLEKPATLTLPHSLSSWSQDMEVFVHHEDDAVRTGGNGAQRLSRPRCSIDENKLELEMERSGKYSVSVMGSEVYKKLSLRPFIPKWMPATRKPIINVMIYDHTEGMDKMMLEDMAATSPYAVKPAHIGKNFVLKLRMDDTNDIVVKCQDGESVEEKTLSTCDVIEFHRNSVDFQVNCTRHQSKDVKIFVTFGTKTVDMICHVNIPSHGRRTSSQSSFSFLSPTVEGEGALPSGQDDDRPNDVPAQTLREMACEVPHNYYIPLGLKLGLEKAKLDSFLMSCANDSEEATYRALEAWKNRQGLDNREKLKKILIEADLRRIAEKYLS
ncbi:uncharacterized protein [Diadema antillarum]|uniref:uncharacterized protein n=1 Tax=Diadema antillarum TaxID=105358 RepID=UPI003A8856A1